MSTNAEYEALREAYLRLRRAAQQMIDAASYDSDGRIYRPQLRELERELAGEPQPNALKFMSVS